MIEGYISISGKVESIWRMMTNWSRDHLLWVISEGTWGVNPSGCWDFSGPLTERHPQIFSRYCGEVPRKKKNRKIGLGNGKDQRNKNWWLLSPCLSLTLSLSFNLSPCHHLVLQSLRGCDLLRFVTYYSLSFVLYDYCYVSIESKLVPFFPTLSPHHCVSVWQIDSSSKHVSCLVSSPAWLSINIPLLSWWISVFLL